MEREEKRVCLITGGARGIGRAIALAMASHGHSVGVLDISEENAQTVSKEINEMGVLEEFIWKQNGLVRTAKLNIQGS